MSVFLLGEQQQLLCQRRGFSAPCPCSSRHFRWCFRTICRGCDIPSRNQAEYLNPTVFPKHPGLLRAGGPQRYRHLFKGNLYPRSSSADEQRQMSRSDSILEGALQGLERVLDPARGDPRPSESLKSSLGCGRMSEQPPSGATAQDSFGGVLPASVGGQEAGRDAEYEFNDDQEAVIMDLEGSIRRAARCTLYLGASEADTGVHVCSFHVAGKAPLGWIVFSCISIASTRSLALAFSFWQPAVFVKLSILWVGM
eukprot:jgi/Botrbrau1/8111/Bobra.0308s0006.1